MNNQTIKDTQLAIKQFKDSIGLDGFSRDNGQSLLLKSRINAIADYHNEILNLDPNTTLDKLPISYKNNVIELQSYLKNIELPIENIHLDKTRPYISINDYKFNYVFSKENKYVFDLSIVAEDVQERLKVSQRISMYDADNKYLESGLIDYIEKNNYISVITKHALYLNTDRIAYSHLDLKWNVQEYVSIWVNNTCFEDSKLNSWLHVKLYNLSSLYNCVWSLYYKKSDSLIYTEVAKGTDNIQPGYAYLSKANALFKPGEYLLKSKIIKYGYYGTDMKRLEWNLDNSRNFIKNE